MTGRRQWKGKEELDEGFEYLEGDISEQRGKGIRHTELGLLV